MSEPKPQKDWMTLTPNERRLLRESVLESIRMALEANTGETACGHLESAQNRLREITQAQWWRSR